MPRTGREFCGMGIHHRIGICPAKSIKMSALFRSFCEKWYVGLCLLSLVLLCNCKTIERDNSISSHEDFTVVRIKRLGNDVYTIYASRNDSIFKIASYYSGKNAHERKLKKGSRFHGHVCPLFKQTEEYFNMMPLCNGAIEFHGVTIGQEPEKGIYDVWTCDDLNGPYLKDSENRRDRYCSKNQTFGQKIVIL